MKFYFLRHAEALDGPNDDTRPLSPHGKKECAAIGTFLKNAGIRFDEAYSSPFLRAQETGDLVLKVLGYRKEVALKTDEALRNETSQDAFDRWLSRFKKEHILLVGHNPSISERVRKLLRTNHSEVFEFPKAGLICIETFNARDGRLIFYVTPETLGCKT